MGEFGKMYHMCAGDKKSVRVHVQSKSICLYGFSICSYLYASVTKIRCER
jgi:hypothetical protein